MKNFEHGTNLDTFVKKVYEEFFLEEIQNKTLIKRKGLEEEIAKRTDSVAYLGFQYCGCCYFFQNLTTLFIIGSWCLKIEQISVYLLSMMSPTDVKLARGHSVCIMASKSDILVFFGGGGLWF